MRYVFAFLALLLSSCLSTTLETLAIRADLSGWKVGYSSDRKGATLVEYIPRGDTISTWSSMLTIQFLEDERRSPSMVMDLLEKKMRSLCPNMKWVVLSKDQTTITYEWSIAGCAGNPNQHELARLLRGKDGIHRIAYVRKVSELESSERNEWLGILAQAYVSKGGNRVVDAP